jgi:hypothetical protein
VESYQTNFDVVRMAGTATYNYVNPVRRDVVNIGDANDNVTVRFTTNNPGPWFFHWWVILSVSFSLALMGYMCMVSHIDWHLEAFVYLV